MNLSREDPGKLDGEFCALRLPRPRGLNEEETPILMNNVKFHIEARFFVSQKQE